MVTCVQCKQWLSCHVTLDTTIVSIGGETRGAEFTDSFVIFNNTGGVAGACGSLARVLALVANTGLASRAASVLQADRDLWVAACGAHTHRLMLQHLAFLAHGADTGLVTRALAASIVTGEV